MKNETLTRIEREAMEKFPENNIKSLDLRIGYMTGGKAELTRAAPVVKALEERITEWEIAYAGKCVAVDKMNSLRQPWNPIYKEQYPEIPAWVTEVKKILETYKNDNV